MKISVLKNFEKFTEKPLCRNFLFNKTATLRPATLLKKKASAQLFSCEFCEIFEVNQSVCIESRIYRFCWLYAIILV